LSKSYIRKKDSSSYFLGSSFVSFTKAAHMIHNIIGIKYVGEKGKRIEQIPRIRAIKFLFLTSFLNVCSILVD